MIYNNLVKDFASRTRANLLHIKERVAAGADLYEVTAIINSMLGLLVFPEQKYYNSIPQIPLAELSAQGWPIPEVVGEYSQVSDLRQLMRYMRNAISHGHVRFNSDSSDQIVGLQLWNVKSGSVNWEANLSIANLELISTKFVDLILSE